MAEEQDEAQQIEDEVLELTEEVEAPEVKEETEAQEAALDDEEVIVSFGDEAAPASEEAPEWVRDLRKRNRELERELAEAKKAQPAPTVTVRPKPTLESCEYDEERFEREFNEYLDEKAAAEAAKTEAEKAKEEAEQKYRAKVETYGTQKTTLGVKDFEEAEAAVISDLNDVQQAVLIAASKGDAKIVYALGKHPDKRRELASITDPYEFAFAAGQLSAGVKMERRPRTQPESTVRGSAPLGTQGNKTLERLEAEAERTGDRTKLIAYRKQLKAQGR
jgi:hypothetical protein